MRFRSSLTPPRVAAFAFVCLLASGTSFAAWNPTGEVVPSLDCQIGTGTAACPDISRGLYTFWGEGGVGGRVLRAHRRHADGSTAPEWPPGGATVGLIEGHVGPLSLAAVPDGAGGAYVISWSPYLSSPNRIQVWRIGDAGGRAAGWPDSGLFVGTIGNSKDAFVVSDGAGGAFVGWVELLDWTWTGSGLRSLNAVRMVRVLAAGTVAPGWSAAGNSAFEPVPSGQYSERRTRTLCVADGAGGAWIAHADSSDGLLDARLIRLTATGARAPGFPAEGVLVGSTGSEQLVEGFAPDGAGGVFTYGYFGQYPNQQVRLSRFAPTGLPASGWTAGGMDPLPGSPGTRAPGPLASDGTGGTVLAQSEWSASGSTRVFRLLRVDSSGSVVPGWQSQGVAIADTFSYFPTILLPDGTGGAFLVGTKDPILGTVYPPRYKLMVARVEGGGGFPTGWSSVARTVTDSSLFGMRLSVADGLGSAFLVSPTTPAPSAGACQVLAFRIGPDGSSVAGVEPGHTTLASFSASPNPSLGSVGLTLTLSEASHASVEVLDAGGRRIRTLGRGALRSGRHQFVWDGQDDGGRPVAPGVYLVRATGPRQPIATKVVRVL